MNTLTLVLNTATNLFAIPALLTLYRKDMIGFSLLLSSFIASCLMHITETKHDLKPFILKDYSNIFLNIDRVLSHLMVAYTLYLVRNVPLHNLMCPAIKFAISGIALGIGELTNDLVLYNILHTGWHYGAFSALNCVFQ